MNALQLTVLAIFGHASSYEWSVQGFGLLRLYIRDVGRLHIWDSALRYPNVSMVHNHSWNLHSTIVAGRLINTRYAMASAPLSVEHHPYHGQRLITGYETRSVSELGTVFLRERSVEHYGAGDHYWQAANEIHRTDAEDGTVSIMARQEDENGQADVYWPSGTEWGTAKPRVATPDEVATTIAKALRGKGIYV